MATLLAFLAACCFAVGNVLQQKGDVEASSEARDPRFLVRILRRPVWLAGLGTQVAGWILQALALRTGALMTVQSIVALSLVIALPLGAKITSQQIGGRVIAGAVVMVVGIVRYVLIGSPQGATSRPDAAAWWSAILATAAVIGLLTGFARHTRRPASSAGRVTVAHQVERRNFGAANRVAREMSCPVVVPPATTRLPAVSALVTRALSDPAVRGLQAAVWCRARQPGPLNPQVVMTGSPQPSTLTTSGKPTIGRTRAGAITNL